MSTQKNFAIAAVLLIGALLFTGCSKKVAQVAAPDRSGSDITRLVSQAGDFSEPAVHNLEVPDAAEDSVNANGEMRTCITTHHSIALAPSDYPVFDPNAEVGPGGALQGGTIGNPTAERIIAKRGPGTVIISNVTGATISSVNVPEVTQAAILDGANRIIASQPSSFPARFTLAVDRVQSQTELALKLHANASFFGLFSSSASFGFDEHDGRNRFLVRLNQSFYTLLFERPSSIDAFFDPSVTSTDLAPFVGPGNPPVYVSSVTYGRIFYLLIESSESAETMDASIHASFLGLFGAGGTVKHVSQLANLRVRVFALGGDANAAMEAVRTGPASFDAFMNALKAGNKIGAAAPLSYVVRSVLSDRVVKNSVAYDYVTRDCALTTGPVIRFVADAGNLIQSIGNNLLEKGFFGSNPARVDRWQDVGQSRLHSATALYQAAFGGAQAALARVRAIFLPNAINGHGAVAFNQGVNLLYPTRRQLSFLDFDASPLAGHDITMMFVGRYRRLDALAGSDSSAAIVRGASPAPGQAARFGFAGRSGVFYSQNDAPTSGQRLSPSPSDFAIYTVVQSASAGTKVFVNGALVASDPNRHDRLAGFPGGMLGLIGTTSEGPIQVGPVNEQLDLADALFFDKALSAGSRAQWESSLARRYGLILFGITASTMDITTWTPGQMPAVKRATAASAYR